MKIGLELLPPIMPNFVRFKTNAQLKQDGLKEASGMDIADFTEEQANDYANLMKDAFIAHYKERKKRKSSLKEITGL